MGIKINESDLAWYVKVWLFICRFFLNLHFKLGTHRLWSSIHRFLFDRKWKNEVMVVYTSVNEIASWMRGFVWKKDGPLELWDAVCTPQKVQAVGRGNSPHGNDCDEEAIYVSNSILLGKENGFMKDISDAFFFTVLWMEEGGKPDGHNVCLIAYADGKYAYMDYGLPSGKYGTIDEVADLIRYKYSGWNSKTGSKTRFVGICWALLKPETLKCLKVKKV